MIKNTYIVKIDWTFDSQAEISKKNIYILKCLTYCTNVLWCKIFVLIHFI